MTVLVPTAIPSTGSLEVIGEGHYQTGIQALIAAGLPIAALLIAETGNPYDPTAVRVLLTNRQRAEKVGYLDRDVAAQWWPKLAELAQHGKVAAGAVRFVEHPNGTLQVAVDVVPEPLFAGPLSLDITYEGVGQTVAAPPIQVQHTTGPMTAGSLNVNRQVSYVRQQQGHSIIVHLLLGFFILWINVIYITVSPNHYWHA